jgi:phage portal protein BeeE
LDPRQVTHFRKPNPFNHYWGMPALEALMVTVLGDRAASEWNRNFFAGDVAIPAGILVIPPNVSDADRDRVSDELSAKHGKRRATAVLRADVGATVYHAAGLGPHDADFKEGRLLSRQEVYEALDLPLGVMSEASTEAHARVAERRLMTSVRRRHERIERKLNSDAMGFWPRWQKLSARFEDVRHDAIDWDQQSKKIKALERYLDEEEIRRDAGYKPRKHSAESAANNGRAAGGRDSGALQREGQETNVVE